MNELTQVIKSRRSVRKFERKPVPEETVRDILDCARLAPTANNVQPWRFIVVSDESKRKAIARISANQSFIAEAPVVIVCCGKKYVDRWRMDYNHYRPHSSLDYMAPAAFAAKCLEQGSATLRLTQDKENMCNILS